SNAVKFTQQGEVRLRILPDPLRSNFIQFSVSDTGIGISEDKQKVIFEAFQQADGSTRRKFGGTGLGLSISREIVKLLGGNIGLKSRMDEGSTFTIQIPINKAFMEENLISTTDKL